METRRMIVALAASMLVFMVWMMVGPLIINEPTGGRTASTQPAAAPTTTAGAEGARRDDAGARTATKPGSAVAAADEAKAPTKPATARAAAPDEFGDIRVVQDSRHQKELGNDDPNGDYPLLLLVKSRGAGIANADLAPVKVRYRNFPPGDKRADLEEDPYDSYDLLRPVTDDATGADYLSFVTEEVNLLVKGGTTSKAGESDAPEKDLPIALGDKHWTIEKKTYDDCQEAVCSIVIEAAGKPMLRVTKTYTVFKGTDNYTVTMDLAIESLDGKPHEVIVTQRGPINVHQQDMRGDSRKVYHAITADEGYRTGIVNRSDTVKEVTGDDGKTKLDLKPVFLPGKDEDGELLWAALGNQYFAAIVTPVIPKDGNRVANSRQISATQVIHLTDNQGSDENADLTFRSVTKPLRIEPGTKQHLAFDLFLGPKERDLFQNPEEHPTYAERHYLATIHEEYYSCVWTPLAELMSNLLIGLHHYVWPHNWGLAIIILVLVVRVILHPITKKGQMSMTRMQARMMDLQPKLDEIKKKYGNDRNKLNTETMKLYKEEGINPASNMLGCLPLMLQMPIWVALWATLSNTIELRHASFMVIPGHWIKDLSSPDALYRFSKSLDMGFFQVESLNLLPFLWGISMVLQQKLTPRPKPGRTSEQLEQQQRMMYMMAVLFTVMFYSFPSGLTLYIMASNFFGLIEQWQIRKHVEAEEAGKTAKTAKQPTEEPPKPKKKSEGFFASMMKKVDKFDQDQRAIKGKKRKG